MKRPTMLIAVFAAAVLTTGCGENSFLPEDIPLRADVLPIRVIEVDPPALSAGNTATVRALIRNQGALAAKQFSVRCDFQGSRSVVFGQPFQSLTSNSVTLNSGLAGGFTAEVVFTLELPTFGDRDERARWTDWRLLIIADSTNDVSEANSTGDAEDNNEFPFEVVFSTTGNGDIFKNG